MGLYPKKSYRFLYHLVVLLIIFSCSRKADLYQIKETKGISLEINKDLGADSSFIRFLQPYSDSLNKTMGRVISFSECRMSKGFPEGLLGNFLTDLIVEYSKKNLNLKIDFGLQNNGGFRADLPAGPVTIKNLYEIMPFDNELIILEMNYASMKELIKYVSSGEDISVSGIRFIIHKKNSNEAFINGQPIDTTRTYLMATSDYLANGGSGMHFLKVCKRAGEPKMKIRDIEIAALEEKYASKQNLNSKLDGRIKVVE